MSSRHGCLFESLIPFRTWKNLSLTITINPNQYLERERTIRDRTKTMVSRVPMPPRASMCSAFCILSPKNGVLDSLYCLHSRHSISSKELQCCSTTRGNMTYLTFCYAGSFHSFKCITSPNQRLCSSPKC
jgi:hypothetical protein